MGIRRLPLAVACAALLVCAPARGEALAPAAHGPAPAKQDVDAIDVIDAMNLDETIVTEPLRDTTTGLELERPDKVEPIEKQEQPTAADSVN